VLESYLDGSGTDPNQEVVAVAGWGASEAEWDHWERLWLQMLAELNIKRWHHTHFLSTRGEYENWPEAKFLLAEGMLTRIFNEIGLLGIGAAVWRADYNAALASGRWKRMPPNPYAFCMNDCGEGLIHGFHEAPEDKGVAIYADQDGKSFEMIGRELLEWHAEYNRRNERAVNAKRDISVTFGSNQKYVPLQGADVLANETYRYMFKRTGMPKLGGIFVGTEDTASPIIRKIHGTFEKRGALLDVVLYNSRMLENRLDMIESGEIFSGHPDLPRRFIQMKNIDP
jgi:hypothetical protein